MADPPDPPRFRAIQVNPPVSNPTTGDSTQGLGINNKGQVSGRLRVSGDPVRGFVWLPYSDYNLTHGLHPVVAEGTGHFETIAAAINDNGLIAGWRTAGFDVHLNIWNLPAHTSGDIIGEEIEPISLERVAINNNNVVIGTQLGTHNLQAFVLQWMANGNHVLEPLGPTGTNKSLGLAIGDSGLAAGHFYSAGCGPGTLGCKDLCAPCHIERLGAWWIMPDVPLPLDAYGDYCGPDELEADRWPNDINIYDHIVGAGMDPALEHLGCVHVAAFWANGTAPIRALPWPSGMDGKRTEAHSITDILEDETQFVAGANVHDDVALLWRGSTEKLTDGSPSHWEVFDLNDPAVVNLCDTQFTVLREATGVNNMGWITGYGQWSVNGTPHTRAFVLVPLHLCPGDLVGSTVTIPDGKVDVHDLIWFLTKWGTCPSGCCWADINDDGKVDFDDLTLLLSSWGNCHGHPDRPVQSLEDALAAAGITWQDWLDFLDVLENGTPNRQEYAICNFLNWITMCDLCVACQPAVDP